MDVSYFDEKGCRIYLRKKKFVDLPVTEKTREKVRIKKGRSSYDDFINKIIDFDLSGDKS